MPVNIQLSKIDFLRIQESEVRKLLSPDYWLLTSLVSWWAWVESNYRPHPYQGCALPAELQARGIERRSDREYRLSGSTTLVELVGIEPATS